MPFLDSNGLQTYTAKLKNLLNGFVPVTRKVNNKALITDITLTAEDIDGLPYYEPSISNEGLLSFTNNAGLQNPEPVNIMGPSGPDGNPIGTVISYMGVTVPKDYLICDGTLHNINNYSKLANFFQTQFGSKNYFGGNGTTTFAVPDLRNLFLRGYHGTATALSGNIGVKQEATDHPNVQVCGNSVVGRTRGEASGNVSVNNSDTEKTKSSVAWGEMNSGSVEKLSATYTSRPVNMAVLYCIKAIESTSMASGGIDSITDEQIDALFSAG